MRSLISYILEARKNTSNKLNNEILIAIAVNIKTLSKNKKDSLFIEDADNDIVKDAIKIALFGPKYKDNHSIVKRNGELKAEALELYNKYINAYKQNRSDITDIDTSAFDDDTIMSKVNKYDVKDDYNSKWHENIKNFANNVNLNSEETKEETKEERKNDKTPKSDVAIYKQNGKEFKLIETLSIKKSGTTQAMSGNFLETGATLLSHANRLNDDYKQKICSLFVDKDGKSIDWTGVNTKRNEKLTETLRSVISDKNKNKAFIIAVLTESLTGASKFNKGSSAIPDSMLTITKDGKLIVDDITTFIVRTYQSLNEKSFRISHKSSNGNKRAVLRIILPTHTEQYDDLTEDENKEFADLIEIIKETIKSEKIESDWEEDNFEDIIDVNNEDHDDDNEYDSDEIEEYTDKETGETKTRNKPLPNPAKIWHRRKRKNSSYMTKSYYSKNEKEKEKHISAQEYKEKVEAYRKAKHKSN